MSDIADQQEINRLNAKVEALEGEVADSLPWKLFYKDGLDLEQIGERLNVDPYSLSPWLYAPLLKQQGHPYESALKAAEARAERLEGEMARLNQSLAAIADKRWDAETRAERLRVALEEIRDMHVPDQPAAVGRSREEWVETCHTKLRIMAIKALEDDKQ